MANIPTPRSWSQIVGDLIAAFNSRYGTTNLKPGNPILSIFEAVAQSDLRNSQDIFNLLAAGSLSRATGQALDLRASDENVFRITQSPATGAVTISDSSFTKISSKIYAGKSAPIVGSAVLYVSDASLFPASGSVYIGRGTTNFEGPLAYTSKSNPGTGYWVLNLGVSSYTQKFHNANETVVLAQGGDRVINAGTTVQTPQGNSSTALQYNTLYSATIPDGETSITGVQVVARSPGITGNIPAGSINAFVTPPFVGAIVTNPLPFTNAQPTESDDTFRERFRNIRQSRSKGTALAIKTGVIGITSSDENKRISSAQVVSLQGLTPTLFVDDGTGYEEISSGVPIETLVDLAVGGEQYFSISKQPPVTKAFIQTTFSAPFNLASGSKLSMNVGGVRSDHTFDVSQFKAINNASAYEVAASINSDATCLYSARTANSGQNVVVFAKADSSEQIEAVTAVNGVVDANAILGFPLGRVDTMRLYKNDLLLNKDGQPAIVASSAQSTWSPVTSPATLILEVDNTGPVTYTFVDNDFVVGNTGFATLAANNTLAAWATVFNAKIPGVTTTVAGNTLVLTSNLGPNSRSEIAITGGTLVSTARMFVYNTQTALKSVGTPNDYTLDRNTGHLKLTSPLAANDKLTIGTANTRAFIQSGALSSGVTLANPGHLYFVVDGAAQIVSTGLANSTVLSIANASVQSWGNRVRITSGTSVFSNVKVGDWAIMLDPVFAGSGNQGTWRVASVPAGGFYFEIERTPTTPVSVNIGTVGITFVRTPAEIQVVTLPAPGATVYYAQDVVNSINSTLKGATAYVYRTNQVRVRTNTFGKTGDISLVAADLDGLKVLLPVSSAVANLTSHIAGVETSGYEYGTPEFVVGTVVSTSSKTTFVQSTSPVTQLTSGHHAYFKRNLPDSSTLSRFGTNNGYQTALSSVNGTAVTVRTPALQEFLPQDRFYAAAPYAINGQDNLTVVVDQDSTTKRYVVPMYRKVAATSNTYGTTNTFTDTDNGNLSIAQAFGLNFNFSDFAVYTRSRVKSHYEGGDNTKTVLWRYTRYGAEGNNVTMAYVYPSAPSQPVGFSTTPGSLVSVNINLPSGAARTGYMLRNSSKIGTIGATSGSIWKSTYILGYSISSAARTAGVTTLTLDVATPGATNHGFAVNDKIYVSSTNGSFQSGFWTITATTATTVSYSESQADQAATPSIGTVSFDALGAVTLLGSNVALNDVVSISGTGLPSGAQQTGRITALGNQYFSLSVNSSVTISTVPTWSFVNQAAGVQFYPINTATSTGAAIASAINAIAATNPSCPVTAVAVGVGGVNNGVISQASYDEFAFPNYVYSLGEGINWIQSNTNPGSPTSNYTFTFKNAVASNLVNNSDWGNEDVRLVPSTAQNLVDWLNCPGVSGLFSVAEVAGSTQGFKLQLSTLTAGSSGSIQIQGGTANSVAASIVGSMSSTMIAQVKAADAVGLSGNMWVRADNASPVSKIRFDAGTVISAIDGAGNFTLDATSDSNAWDYATTAPSAVNGFTWQVEKQGNFTAFVWSTLDGVAPVIAGIQQGDWVIVSVPGAGTVLSATNLGTFKIVRADTANKIFWIENSGSVEEIGLANLSFLTFNSILPGDTVTISTPIWGTNNQGSWVVQSIDLTNQKTFKVATTGAKTTSVYSGPTALGSSSSLVQCVEGTPSSLIKKIVTISPNTLDSTLVDITFDSAQGYRSVSSAAGTIIKPLDKLGFPVNVNVGVDGYKVSGGLVGQANKVVYGDPTDPATYPGIIAVGANLNISGPLVRRISLGLSLRVRSGVSATEIVARVKSVVAGIINQTGIGTPIALSDIITAAGSVNGVLSVTIVSPVYSVGNDLITIQPFEKPLVVNLDQDISVTLVGT